MGKAGRVLREVIEKYDISQGKLAQALGIARSNVHRWVAEIRDPNSETVFIIVEALRQLKPDAAEEFIGLYANESDITSDVILSDRLSQASFSQLPTGEGLDIAAFSRLFAHTTNSYKYIFFFSLLDVLKRQNFDASLSISLQDITIEMLANSWYPHNYFRLSFGVQDKITQKLDSLNLKITEPILKFTDTDKKLLRVTISKQNLDNSLVDYVPFRINRPFFQAEFRGLPDQQVDKLMIKVARENFETRKPLLGYSEDASSIFIHPDWVEYIRVNYPIIRGWASWQWLEYMQSRNPSVPGISNKLFPPQKRESLTSQTKYWELILQETTLRCIYSGEFLAIDNLSLDHYLPWSFVTHDWLWNLIPTVPNVNSSKSNNLPSDIYFSSFVAMQHQGLTISFRKMKAAMWTKRIEPYILELKISDKSDLLNIEKLRKAYEVTIATQITLAASQGFSANWIYKPVLIG